MRKVQVKADMIELVSPPRSGGERSEPERSGGLTSSAPPMASQTPAATVPDPEVNAKATRRQFSSEYKRRILQEATTPRLWRLSRRCCAVKACIRRT